MNGRHIAEGIFRYYFKVLQRKKRDEYFVKLLVPLAQKDHHTTDLLRSRLIFSRLMDCNRCQQLLLRLEVY